MNREWILIIGALLLVVLLAALALEEKWKALLLEQRLKIMKGASDRRLVRWEDLLAVIAGPLHRSKDLADTEKALQRAGFPKPWHLDLFLLIRTTLFLLALVLGWIFIDVDWWHITAKPLPPLEYLFLLFAAGRLPGWILAEVGKRRQNRIRLFIPKAVDLLTICMSCGISLEEAFERVADEIENRAPEVAKEFRMTRYEMLVVNRTAALKRLEARSGVREMEILANSLLQSIQYGTPLTEALQAIASEARAGQLAELEQKAGSISATIGVPLIVFVLFPVIALIVAPAAIQLARSF